MRFVGPQSQGPATPGTQSALSLVRSTCDPLSAYLYFLGTGCLIALSARDIGRAQSLFDSGATHFVHPNDDGAIPGSWRSDVPYLTLGDGNKLQVYGSVEKLFRPEGLLGEPLRRRVLIAPGVALRVWSHASEVDLYGSTVIDSPTSTYVTTSDGRRYDVVKTGKNLRVINADIVRSGQSDSFVMAVIASSAPSPEFDDASLHALLDDDQLGVHRERRDVPSRYLSSADGQFYFISGLGKPKVKLSYLETLRLWHARLAHPPLRTLLATLANFGVFKLDPDASDSVKKAAAAEMRAALHAYERETCDICNACKQRHHTVNNAPHRPWTPGQVAELSKASVHRALVPLRRVLMDVFGPVPYLSAQHNYRFLVGFVDEATSYRWVFGVKTHTAESCESIVQLFRAAIRLVLGDIDVIRMDNAPEFARAARWAEFLADCGIFPEYSVPYDARAMGRIERTWGIGVPSARCLLDQLGGGRRHWFTAVRHSVILANAKDSSYKSIDGKVLKNSAEFRIYQREIEHRKLRAYGAAVRFLVDPIHRDGKFDESASAGFYVGISPSNASAMWVWNGSSHETVGGSSVVDETPFIKPMLGMAARSMRSAALCRRPMRLPASARSPAATSRRITPPKARFEL